MDGGVGMGRCHSESVFNKMKEFKTISEFIKNITKNNSAKIAICNTFFTRAGGRSRVIEQQARELTRDGYHVTVYALIGDPLPNEKFKQKKVASIENPCLRVIYRLIFPFTPLALKLIRDLKNYDVIISHDGYPFGLLSYLTKSLFNVVYVYWYHHPLSDIEKYFSGIKKFYMKLLRYFEQKSRFIRNADYIVSVSEVSKADLKKAIKREDIVVIPNKLDYEKFLNLADTSQLERKMGISKSDPIILFVGRITPQKNVHILIEVFNLVKQNIPQAKLIVVGRPAFKEYFMELKKQANKDVIFTGFVEDNELGVLYQVADVYVSCSLSEGFNLPLIEAQYFGLPVVAFDIPTHREVIGDKGFLVKRGDVRGFANRICQILKQKGYLHEKI